MSILDKLTFLEENDKLDFTKLYRKLCILYKNNFIEPIETLNDISSLSCTKLERIQGVGKLYAKLLDSVQKKILSNQIIYNLCSIDNNGTTINIEDIDTSKLYLSYKNFSLDEQKCLKKINADINDILKEDHLKWSELTGVGEKFSRKIESIYNKVLNEYNEILIDDKYFLNWETKFIFPLEPVYITDYIVDELISTDITDFINNSTQSDTDIFVKRYGIAEKQKTLDEIGQIHGLTKERVRQKQKKITTTFKSVMRISPHFISKYIQMSISQDLHTRFLMLKDMFYFEEYFYNFLEDVFELKHLNHNLFPSIPICALDTFFANNGFAIPINKVTDFLQKEFDISNAGVLYVLNILQKNERVIIENDLCYPRNISRHLATACVLKNHKRGLPWQDIAQIVNKNKYSNKDISTNRIDQSALLGNDNENRLVYQYGKGLYRHISYFIEQQIEENTIFDILLEHHIIYNNDVYHLNDIYSKNNEIKKYHYYDVRHIVKTFGENHGWYFDGKSQSETISIIKDFDRINQKQVIENYFKSVDHYVTAKEVSDNIKSRNINHAGIYLSELQADGIIVSPKKGFYIHTSKHFSQKIILDAMCIVSSIFENNKIIELSIFENIFSIKLQKNFNRQESRALMNIIVNRMQLHQKASLYSLQEIRYNNIEDALIKNIFPHQVISLEEIFYKFNREIYIDKKIFYKKIKSVSHVLNSDSSIPII